MVPFTLGSAGVIWAGAGLGTLSPAQATPPDETRPGPSLHKYVLCLIWTHLSMQGLVKF